jgi:hypothetical protein
MNRTRSSGRLALLAAVVLAVPLSAVSAVADDGRSGVRVLDRAASDAIDIAIIAEKYGWTVAATGRHMTDQDTFGALQVQIEQQFPTTFAGAEFAEGPGGRSYLRFTGTVPAAARTLAAASGLNVELTGGRRFSVVELASRSVAVVQHLVGAGHPSVSAAVRPNGTIEVAASGAAKPGSALPPALREAVRVTFVPHAAAGDFSAQGGAKVLDTDEGDRCTTGFSVRETGGTKTGVSTAAHCDGIDRYEMPWSSDWTAAPFEDQHLGLSGDVEWHTTQGTIDAAEYYADGDPDELREVNRVETGVAFNNVYCLYSHVGQDRTCDTVDSTIVTTFTAGLASFLVGMDDMNAEPGDSGGPWSYSTEAAGSVVGWYWSFGNHDSWNRAWFFDGALGVQIITQ